MKIGRTSRVAWPRGPRSGPLQSSNGPDRHAPSRYPDAADLAPARLARARAAPGPVGPRLAPRRPGSAVAEKSDFKATARHADGGRALRGAGEVVAVDPLDRARQVGRGAELAVDDRQRPAGRDPRPRRRRRASRWSSSSATSTPADEVDGKEALPILVRELVATPHNPLLEHLILAVAPIYNADGNERISKDNRPRPGRAGGGDGPARRERQGARPQPRLHEARGPPRPAPSSACSTSGTRSSRSTLHTTNGSHHRYTLTYDGPKNPAGDRALIASLARKTVPRGRRRGREGDRLQVVHLWRLRHQPCPMVFVPRHPSLRHDLHRPCAINCRS